MVAGVLRRGLSREHIYKILEGIRTGEYDGKQMVVPAAMGLFLQTVADLVVLVIQLGPKGIVPLCRGAIHLETSRLCSIITV